MGGKVGRGVGVRGRCAGIEGGEMYGECGKVWGR